MSISYAKPSSRLHLVLLAALVAAALALLTGTGAGGPLAVEDAFAHGSCSNSMTGPFKTTGGRIKGTNAYTCTGSHASVTGCVELVIDTGTAFVPVTGKNCRAATSSAGSPRAGITAPCSQTGFYRVRGSGFANNVAGETPHESAPGDVTAGKWIQCAPSDLANANGVFDDVNTLLG